MNDDSLKDRIIAMFTLYTVGDVIGFNFGLWSSRVLRKTVSLDVIHEILYKFIEMGGINALDMSKWKTSGNTLTLMANTESLISASDLLTDDGISNYIKHTTESFGRLCMIIAADQTVNLTARTMRNNMMDTIENIYKKKHKIEYDKLTTDNSCAVRTICLGLINANKDVNETFIKIVIENCRISHTSPIGFLPGLAVALFAKYAVEGIDVSKWPKKMMQVIESEHVRKYISNDDLEKDFDIFMLNWKKYIDFKLDEDETPIKIRGNVNILNRSKFYIENFEVERSSNLIGVSGISMSIMAYDCLLDVQDKWETLVIYSALHFGDTASVACVACGLYGAMYGFKNVPGNNIEKLEIKERLYDIAVNMYKKYLV